MTIAKGDKIPSVKLKKLEEGGLQEIDFAEYIKGRRVVIFGVPGAFTPVCTTQHVPGFAEHEDEFAAKGIDEIICLAVNDPFVMNHWARETGVAGKVTMVPDGNAELTTAMGLELDLSDVGLGTRSQRYSMIAKDGVVEHIEIEQNPGELQMAAAEACLARL